MSRKASGTVRILKDDHGKPQWHGKWTRADGTRSKWLPLPGGIAVEPCCYPTEPACAHRRQANAEAARMAPKVRQASEEQPRGAETVQSYADRWHKWRESRGLVCVADDRARMKTHAFDVIGSLDVAAVTRRDLERLVEHLDERIIEVQRESARNVIPLDARRPPRRP